MPKRQKYMLLLTFVLLLLTAFFIYQLAKSHQRTSLPSNIENSSEQSGPNSIPPGLLIGPGGGN